MESPKHQRIAAYAAIKKEDGGAALEEIKEAVKAEYQRKLEWKIQKNIAKCTAVTAIPKLGS